MKSFLTIFALFWALLLLAGIVFGEGHPEEISYRMAPPSDSVSDYVSGYLSDVSGDISTWNEVRWSSYLAWETYEKAETEYRLPDGSRIDVYPSREEPGGTVAWEVEWSDKWTEGIGQALQYHVMTGRDPGLWILLRRDAKVDYNRIIGVVTDLRRHGYNFHLRFQRTVR